MASNATGLVGYLRQLADNSHIWIILVLTGILVGAIAAAIDVASDWLGDLKTGYCSNVSAGGKFYLNKAFCCWGYNGTLIAHDRLRLVVNWLLRLFAMPGLEIVEHINGRSSQWWQLDHRLSFLPCFFRRPSNTPIL